MSSTQRRLIMIILFLLAVVIATIVGVRATQGQTTMAATRPGGSNPARRVLIISIDGLRPDVLLRAEAPTLRAQMKAGSFTMWARTVQSANTLPSHTSMMTGVGPRRHGIQFNDSQANSTNPSYPRSPTLLQIAQEAGLSTAIISGKSKFTTLARPGTVDHVAITERARDPGSDEWVVEKAVAIIRQHNPRVVFVHLPAVDTVGHRHGWGTAAQLAATKVADECVRQVLEAHRAADPQAPTLTIITADHGGAALTHRPDDPRALHIPWIVTGPHVKADFDLTADEELVVRTEDTFATACSFLGLTPRDAVEGKPIQQAFTVRMPTIPTTQPAAGPPVKKASLPPVRDPCCAPHADDSFALAPAATR